MDDLIPIHKDEDSGFMLRDRVFRSQELIRLTITALEDRVDLCKKYFEYKKKGSIIKAEVAKLQSQIKEVRSL